MKIHDFGEFCDQQIEPTKSISGAFLTSKYTGVLALRAMFKISALTRVPLTRGGCHMRLAWSGAIELDLNVACRDGFLQKPFLESNIFLATPSTGAKISEFWNRKFHMFLDTFS